MTKAKTTKRALLLSVLSMMLCLSMLVGSTFAWFTDSVTSGVNKIVAGNLDVELEYAVLDEDGSVKEWKSVEGVSLFDENALWEPGYTQVVYLKVRNAGTLALKYKFAVNVVNETLGATEDGTEIKLSEHLVFGQVESEKLTTYATREDAWAAVKNSTKGLKDYTKESQLAAKTEEYVALVVYMPTTVGNEANYRGNAIPTIELGINLVATQAQAENDSFGDDYDRVAALIQDGYAMVATADDLNKALAEGKNVVLADDITVSNSVLNAAAGTVIDGNGNKIIGLGTDSEHQGLQLAKNVEYRNIEFELEKGWGVITKSAKFINCTFNAASPYLSPAQGDDIVVDGCTLVDTILQICYNEGGKKPESAKTIITNNKFIVDNTNDRAHAIAIGGGSPEFWANGAETVTIEGNTFVPNYSENTYIAYYIYGDYGTTLTSVPAYSNNTFNGDANYSMNGVASENQHPLSRESGYLGNEEIVGLTWISEGFYKDTNNNFYASTAAGLKAMNDELAKNSDFNKIHGKSYNLLCNINANGQEWKCVSLTTGSTDNEGIIFNGNGYTIRNMNITGGGMFSKSASGSTSDGNTTIKNLTLDNATVTGGYHVGAIWSQMYGSIVLDDVHVVNSSITGTCNVGGLIGRSGDQGHSTIKFINCSVSDTIVTANGNADPIGASAFLGATLKTSGRYAASVALTFEGENTATNVILNSDGDTTGGGIYDVSVYDNGWIVEVVDTFADFDNRD